MKTITRFAGWGTAALLLLVLAQPTHASDPLQWPEWRTNDDTVGQEYQEATDAAVQPDGSWIGVWVDYRMGYPALFLRAFDANDQPLAPSFALTDGLGLYSLDINAVAIGEPSLAPIGDGSSVLVWNDGRDIRNDWTRIRAAIVGPGGILTGPVTVTDEDRPEVRSGPRVSVSQGRACVVWIEGGGSSTKAYGQVLDLNGLQRVHADNEWIDPAGMMPQRDCRIVPSAAGWVTAWQGWQQGSPNPCVLLRNIGADGGIAGDPVAVDSGTEWTQGEVALTAVPGGGFFVAWVAAFDSRVQFLGRQVDASLSPVAPVFQIVAEGSTVTPSSPTLTMTGPGSALVVWTDGNANHSRFYARNINLPSTPTGSFVIVDDPSDPPGGLLIPRNLALHGGGGVPARILWTDNRDGWDLDYYAKVDSAGVRLEDPVAVQMAEGTASQLFPAVALFNDGGAMAVWEDFRTGGLTIYGRLLDITGAPIGSSFRISEGSSGSVSVPATNLRDLRRNQPSITTTSDGRAVVAWTTFLSGGRTRVLLQHYNRNGARVGVNVRLPDDGQSPQLAPSPQFDGKYWVAWRDTGTNNDGNILAKRFYSDGTEAGDTVHIADHLRESQTMKSNPVIASSGAGEFVVAWLDNRRGNMDVFAQRISALGRKIEMNIPVSGDEGGNPILQANPAVAAAPDRYVVVWDDNPLLSGRVAGLLVILASAAKSGAPQSGDETPFAFITGSPGYKYPRVAMDTGGRFVVTYWDTQADSARVMARRFTADAVPDGLPYPLLAVNGRTVAIPADVAVAPDLVQFAYADSRDDCGWDVRVRRVDWNFEGEYSPVLIADYGVQEDAGTLVLRWSVPLDAAGAFYRVWRDAADEVSVRPGAGARLVSTDPVGPIVPAGADYLFRDDSALPGQSYAYWIQDGRGEYAGPWIGALPAGKDRVSLHASRNPFRDAVRLAWSSSLGARLTLTIYDASGRLVRELLDDDPAVTMRGETTWDGRDGAGRGTPAGLYWARLRAEPGGEQSVRILRLR